MYDSLSTDGTVEIARKAGALVTQREFDNWAAHQNWGLKNIHFKYPWVFYIDADERMTPELRDSVLKAASESAGAAVAYRVCRRDFYLGRWLKHVQTSPYYLRLFRPERNCVTSGWSIRVSIADGATADLSGYLDHYPFSKGIDHWIARHNSYSTLEARQILENRRLRVRFQLAASPSWPGIFTNDAITKKNCSIEFHFGRW